MCDLRKATLAVARKVQPRMLAEVSSRRDVVALGGFDLVMETAKRMIFFLGSYPRPPLARPCVPEHSLEARRRWAAIDLRHLAVATRPLRCRLHLQVLSSAVQ